MNDVGENSGTKISWYGERGIVNAIVTALNSSGSLGVVQLLGAVKWADDGRPDWIANVKTAALIVEISCNHFGSPDLVLVCTTDSGKRYVVFLEAKVSRYLSSAATNDVGMTNKKFNSSINGQLALKFRFAKALSLWNGQANVVIESSELHDAYSRTPDAGGLGDNSRGPRRLEKSQVLSILQSERLAGLPLEQFYFVALTWDRRPFFAENGVQQTKFRPLFLEEDGTDQWEQTKPRIGWLGYSSIEESEQLLSILGEDYRQATTTMFNRAAPTEIEEGIDPTIPTVKKIKIRQFSKATISRFDELIGLAKRYFGKKAVDVQPRGASIKPFGKVIIKLIPQNCNEDEVIALGIRASLGQNAWNGLTFPAPKIVGRGGSATVFYFLDLKPLDDTIQIANAFFADVAEHLGLTVDSE